MDLLFSIGFYAFAVAVFVGFASWFMAAFELVSIYALTGQLFSIGPVVVSSVESIPLSHHYSPGKRIKLRYTHLKFLKPMECVFGTRLRFFPLKGARHIYSPIKGTIIWTGSQAKFVVRTPMGILVFFLAWLTGWTVGGFMFLFGGSKPLAESIAMLVIGWFFASGMLAFFTWQSRQAARSVVAEVKSFLQGEASRMEHRV